MSSILLPMLATRAEPFDSDDYLFEVKWDGVRALAAIENGRWRLWGRNGSDYTERYAELALLRRLSTGTVIDGELIVLQNGRADFPALLRRHQRCRSSTFVPMDQRMPVHYVVFDLLFEKRRSLLRRPLRERRERLYELLGRAGDVVTYSTEW